MMIVKDLFDWVNGGKRKRERMEAAQKLAIGIGVAAVAGVTAGIIFALKAGKETREDMKKKAVNVLETIKDSIDTHKTTENILNELNQPEK